MPITEKMYPQTLNVHMIAGDAPDVSEMGKSDMLNNVTYMARYYLPMTDIISRPNPYNAGTNIEALAWRETFIDGMRGAYNDALQDYYGVPTAFFTSRIFYNKDMFKTATGSDVPPKTFGELMAVCQKLRDHARRNGTAEQFVPIAGSKYSVGTFIDRYGYAFTASYEPEMDVDLDGIVTDQEAYVGIVKGKVSFQDARVKAYYQCLYELSANFAAGFYSMERQDAAFAFVQGRSAMIASGAWDAASLFEQADFKVGIFDFPLPGPGEKYSEFIAGRGNEAGASAGGTFGVYKFSRNVDQAVDFLQFLTSRVENQKMMQAAQWIPAVLGTQPSPEMLAFAADPTGFSSRVNMYYGSGSQGTWDGKIQTYLEGQQSFETLAKDVHAAIMEPTSGGDAAWYLEWDNSVIQMRSQERVMAMQHVRELIQRAPDAELKNRQLLLQQVRVNDCEGLRYRFQQLRGKPLVDPMQMQSKPTGSK